MKFIIAGGGTAGHINPGIALAKKLREKYEDCEIIFIGTRNGLEVKLVPKDGFKLEFIHVKGFKRKLSIDTLKSIKELAQGLFEAFKIVKQYKPDVVIGTGGYVCGPVLLSASLLRIPTIIHEQNTFPGVTNRILSRFVNKVAVSFKESEKYFKNREKVIFTGNPIRSELLSVDRKLSRHKLGIDKNEKMVIIFGGSRGSESLNEHVVKMIKNNYKGDFKVYFATGELFYEKISKELKDVSLKDLNILPYIHNMDELLAASDLVVCRSGAITISELLALGKPSIMIPSPYVTANHQEYNAKMLGKEGAAKVILEKELTPEGLYETISELLKDQNELETMSQNASKLGIRDAADKLLNLITED